MRGRVVLALVAGGLVVGGCGEASKSEARAELVEDCINGNADSKSLCECIATELERKHGVKTAKRFEALNDEVKSGKQPRAVVASLQTCQERTGPTG